MDIFIKNKDPKIDMTKPKENEGLEASVGSSQNPQTKWLEDIFKKYFVPSYSYAGHGTSERCADSIMREGLYASESDLLSTTIPLCDCGSPEMGECIDKILNWPHRNYKCIGIVAIPNPKPGETGGLYYFNSVFEELENNNKIDLGIQGADRSYKIPKEFLRGYIDVKNKCFVENPEYDPNAVVSLKQTPKRTIGGYKGTTPNVPLKGTEPETF